MSAPIGPGDWVEYVGGPDEWSTGSYPNHWGTSLVIGNIYCVQGIVPGELFEDGRDALELCGCNFTYPNGDRECWDAGRFRPIYRPKSELIHHLQQPAPDAVRELVFDGARP